MEVCNLCRVLLQEIICKIPGKDYRKDSLHILAWDDLAIKMREKKFNRTKTFLEAC